MIDVRGIIARNRAGDAVGLPCFCTANAMALQAILGNPRARALPMVIEATCNQVNQDGGYTGMTPRDFVAWVRDAAAACGKPSDLILLGGDHLGPNPWKHLGAAEAMRKARALVGHYAAAGFLKIHLDTSMACGGEPALPFETVAARAAELCAVAEDHAPNPDRLIYVIGTEVPAPGGETGDMDALQVTSAARLEQTIATHRDAFHRLGLQRAWAKIVAVVTQPGVDFSHTSIHPFDASAARPLAAAIKAHPGLTFEAHSTDYQSTAALRSMVEQHFCFLKVGPELTFRMREALFALAQIEDELQVRDRSDLARVVLEVMQRNPGHWEQYYSGSASELSTLLKYSLSDRIRYYWTDARIAASVTQLLENIGSARIPLGLWQQFVPNYQFSEAGRSPLGSVRDRVNAAVNRYYAACGFE